MKLVILKSLCLCVSVLISTTETQRHREVGVHFPDLSQLEEDVRDQIKSYQDSLVAAVKDPKCTDAKLSAAYGDLGAIYQAYSLNAPARECYLNASKLAPKDFRWIYMLGKLDQLEGRVDDAIKRFQTVASLQPDFIAALVNLGNIYLEVNRLDDAKKSFSSALQKATNNPAAHYGLGQIALSRRSYTEAIEHFEKALTLAPEANRIHYALAMAYRGLRNSEKTKFHLTRQGTVGVKVADPLTDKLQSLVAGARLHLVRGKLALEAKRYQEAAAEFRKALEADPDSVPAHINLGAALTQLGDQKGAAEQFQRALLIDSNNVNAHYNLAVLLMSAKQHQQAIVHLEKVATINPNDFSARYFLAQQLLAVNRAKESLKVAESLYSTTGSLQHGVLVGLALAKLGRCEEAAVLQRKLVARAVEEHNEELQVKLKADFCRP
jgi:tetratricopeptide (TPR) repeat protein